jgi:ribosome-binding protein aMBF1 (putative translation factor)
MNKQQNIENVKKLVSKEKSGLLDKLKWEKENEQWLDRSFQIALKVVRAMRKQNLNQKDLAERMQVPPQYISKMLKGKENLSLQTISKLEDALEIKLITVSESEENPVSFK